MELSFNYSPLKRIQADALAVFVHQDPRLLGLELAAIKRKLNVPIPAADTKDFKGKEGESTVAYFGDNGATRRLIIVGLGERSKLTLEKYRRAAASAAKRARTLQAKSLALLTPDIARQRSEVIAALAEGAALSLYRFDKYITKKEDERVTIDEITVYSEKKNLLPAGREAVNRAQIIARATWLARDLANAPGNEIYPETLAAAARESAEQHGYSATVFDEREIKDLGMGGILGVSQGSIHPPRFIVLEYGDSGKRPVVIIGKGVTFDTGGISIKPSAGMAEMKMDMSGAAAVIGTFQAVAQLRLSVHLVGLIPAVENMPGGSAIRPGDILQHYGGKTSEVDNTDAEGRLILADTLAYADQLRPLAVIDLATLTGACVVALGHFATGMMGNDEGLMRRLKAAGERTYERVWQFPMYDEYEKLIKSDVADVKNFGGRWAGAITAAWFLKKFVGSYRWAHLDIAGTATLEDSLDYTPKGGSGVGVRLLTDFLTHWR